MGGSLFDESKTVFEQQLKDIFKPSGTEQATLFSIISLVFFHNSKLTDLNDVYHLLGLENFVKLIILLDGRTLKLPTSSELKDTIVFALCFYYRELDGKDWPEIHELVPYNFNSISMAYKIKNLNSALKDELKSFLKGSRGN